MTIELGLGTIIFTAIWSAIFASMVLDCIKGEWDGAAGAGGLFLLGCVSSFAYSAVFLLVMFIGYAFRDRSYFSYFLASWLSLISLSAIKGLS